MQNIYKRIFDCGIIPVIKIDDANDALPLAKALSDGGIDVFEVTFRTDAAEEAIKSISKGFPEAITGAGTVSNVETVKKAVDAGAKFIVSPGFNHNVVDYCVKNNIIVIPGVGSATDIESALSYGLEVLKFFPAEANGGLKTLKALSAPYSQIKFMPTGGIDITNLSEYMAFNKIIACGGSWMAKEELIRNKKFDEITRLSKEAVKVMHGFTFAHVSINPDENTAEEIADFYSDLFGFSQRDIGVSIFSTNFIEIMRKPEPYKFGHLAVRTNNLERACAYFEKKGVELEHDTLKLRDGVPYFIYLKDHLGPFKIHLVQ